MTLPAMNAFGVPTDAFYPRAALLPDIASETAQPFVAPETGGFLYSKAGQLYYRNAAGETPVAGSGAVGTPFFNVKDFGAKGDATTDDTAAFLAAIAAAEAAFGGIVWCPSGKYLISSTLTITSSVRIMGPVAGPALGTDTGAQLRWTGGAAPLIYFNGSYYAGLDFVSLDNTGTATNAVLMDNQAYHTTLNNVIIYPHVAFDAAVVAQGSNGHPLVGIYLNRCFIVNNTVGVQILWANLVNFVSTSIALNTTHELVLGGSGTNLVTQFSMLGGSVEGNANETVIVANQVQGARFIGTYFESDGSGYAADIPATATSVTGLSFAGCRFVGKAVGNNTPYVFHVDSPTATFAVRDSNILGFTAANIVDNPAFQSIVLDNIDCDGSISSVSTNAAAIFYNNINFNGTVVGPLFPDSVTAHSDVWMRANVGFYNTTPQPKPTVTGSKGANAALTSLMTALSALGLVTDSTT